MINNHLIMDCMEMQQLKTRYDEAKRKRMLLWYGGSKGSLPETF